MTKFTRRDAILKTGLAAPALLMPRLVRAAAPANYPARNIQFVIPYAPGGGFDVYVRLVTPVMEKYLPRKVSIVPMNIASGAGSRGVSQLYRSRPDGYTIGILNIPGMFILQQQQGTGAYDLDKFTWIGAMGEGEPYLISVGMNSPLKNFDDLKALSARRPVKLSVTGPEGTAYAATLIGSQMMGLRTQLITGYKGSVDYIVAAIRGDSDAVIAALPSTMRFMKGGQLRPLASFETKSTVPGIPDATSLNLPDLDKIAVERLVAGPPGMPADLRDVLSDVLAKAVSDPFVTKWAQENYVVMKPKNPQQTVATLNEQRNFFDKWKKYLAAG